MLLLEASLVAVHDNALVLHLRCDTVLTLRSGSENADLIHVPIHEQEMPWYDLDDLGCLEKKQLPHGGTVADSIGDGICKRILKPHYKRYQAT